MKLTIGLLVLLLCQLSMAQLFSDFQPEQVARETFYLKKSDGAFGALYNQEEQLAVYLGTMHESTRPAQPHWPSIAPWFTTSRDESHRRIRRVDGPLTSTCRDLGYSRFVTGSVTVRLIEQNDRGGWQIGSAVYSYSPRRQIRLERLSEDEDAPIPIEYMKTSRDYYHAERIRRDNLGSHLHMVVNSIRCTNVRARTRY